MEKQVGNIMSSRAQLRYLIKRLNCPEVVSRYT